MEMTFEQYISNPMGKNNAVMSSIARENMRKVYKNKFDNILLREHGIIKYTLMKDSKNNTYWAYIKIPSEIVKNFYYDVVIKFYSDNNVSDLGTDLFKYKIKFYSNDPAFVFTYAHVFSKNDLFIKELSKKMSKEALKTAAKEKNPGSNIGYVKSLYFAYLVMQNRALNKVSKFEAECKPLDSHYLLNNIEDADIKIAKRQEEGAKVSTKKPLKLDKDTFNKASKYITQDTNLNNVAVKTTKTINTIKSADQANKFGLVKKSLGVKKVKKK